MSGFVRLAVETAGESVGVAVMIDADLVASSWVTTRAASSELVVAMVDRALSQTAVDRGSIGEVVACRGPGSFTGIRVGLATVRGLALGLGVPVRTLDTFEVEVAGAVDHPGPIVVAIDARRGQVYTRAFHSATSVDVGIRRRPTGPAQVIDPMPSVLLDASAVESTDRPLLVGSGIARYRAQWSEAFPGASRRTVGAPRVESLARAAAWGWAGDDPSPLYLRPPDAKLPQDLSDGPR